MSYIKKELMPGEKILHRARDPWSVYLLPVVAAAALAAAAVVLDLPTIVQGGAALICLPWLVAVHIRRMRIEFTVTDRRIVIKVGVLRQSSSEILLRTIEDVRVDQGIVDRLYNRGTLILTRTGGVQTDLKMVPDPREFRRQVRIGIETFQLSHSAAGLSQGDVAA